MRMKMSQEQIRNISAALFDLITASAEIVKNHSIAHLDLRLQNEKAQALATKPLTEFTIKLIETIKNSYFDDLELMKNQLNAIILAELEKSPIKLNPSDVRENSYAAIIHFNFLESQFKKMLLLIGKPNHETHFDARNASWDLITKIHKIIDEVQRTPSPIEETRSRRSSLTSSAALSSSFFTQPSSSFKKNDSPRHIALGI